MKFGKLRAVFALPYLPVWLVPTILIGPIIVTGKAIFWGTPFLQFAPWRAAAWEIIRSGHFPLWNPWVGMGAPLAANYQSALFYPPNWLLLTLQAVGGNSLQAWGQAVIILIHFIWAGLGMVFFTRQLGIGKTGQMVAGLAFGSSSYLLDRSGFLSINAAVSWVPWVLAAANRICGPELAAKSAVKPARLPGFLLLAGSFGMQLLTGHAQLTWYTLLFMAAWVIVWGARHQDFRSFLRIIGQFCLGIGLAVGIAAIQLAPTAEYLLQSQRSSAVGIENALNYSFWPWHLLTLIAPGFFGSPVTGDYWFNAFFWEDAVYIGLLPFILGAIYLVKSLFKPSQKDALQKTDDRKALSVFLGAAILVTFIIAFGRYTPVFPFLYRYIPTFSMFQAPARISLLAVVALSISGSLGVDHWRAPAGRGLYWTRLALAGAVAIIIGAGAGWIAIHDVHATFVRALTVAGVWAAGTAALSLLLPKSSSTPAAWWQWGVALLLGADLIAAGWGALPSIDRQYYSTRADTARQVQQIAGGGRIFIDKQSEADLLYKQYLLVENNDPGKDWLGFKAALLADSNVMFGIPSANNFDPLVPDRYSFWMEKLNGLSPAQRAPFFALMDVSVVETQDPQDPSRAVFNPVGGSSRYHWSNCASTAPDMDQAWNLLLANLSDKTPPKNIPVVILDPSSLTDPAGCQENGLAQIRVINENPGGVTLQTNAENAGWLLQADTWYPGWVAQIDGNETPIYPADVAFRAIAIPAGTHQIRFEYRPLSFILGAVISLISCLVIIGCGLFNTRKNRMKIGRLAQKE